MLKMSYFLASMSFISYAFSSKILENLSKHHANYTHMQIYFEVNLVPTKTLIEQFLIVYHSGYQNCSLLQSTERIWKWSIFEVLSRAVDHSSIRDFLPKEGNASIHWPTQGLWLRGLRVLHQRPEAIYIGSTSGEENQPAGKMYFHLSKRQSRESCWSSQTCLAVVWPG